ncbi:MAG: DUF3048 domain-containing protein, partial [Patescibacteria group bacterium]
SARAYGNLALGLFGGNSAPQVEAGTAASTDVGTSTYRLLDGVAVAADTASFWPYAVMVENLPTVRPQRGLGSASVVYETLAEGGSTRFMAVYDPGVAVPTILPVRSARPYYLEWASEYGALYAHAGGSPKALTVIRENSDINDANGLGSESRYFWRDRSLPAPHNFVTSSTSMTYALRDMQLLDRPAEFQPWLFKDDTLPAERGADGQVVEFNFSSGKSYLVEYRYDQQQNRYFRSNAGVPHLDANSGSQITVTNVIVQLVDQPKLEAEKGRLDINVGGTGTAWVFRDGQTIQATWRKASRTDRTRFYDQAGAEVQLGRGVTWVHVLPKSQSVVVR